MTLSQIWEKRVTRVAASNVLAVLALVVDLLAVFVLLYLFSLGVIYIKHLSSTFYATVFGFGLYLVGLIVSYKVFTRLGNFLVMKIALITEESPFSVVLFYRVINVIRTILLYAARGFNAGMHAPATGQIRNPFDDIKSAIKSAKTGE